MRLDDMRGRIDFAVLTVHDFEFEAVLERLPTLHTIEGRHMYNYCEVATSVGSPYRGVVVTSLDVGSGAIQAVAHDVIADLDPCWLLVVGVGDGVPEDECSPGDVVVSSRVHDFNVEVDRGSGDSRWSVAGGPLPRRAHITVANLPAIKSKLGNWSEASGVGPPPAIDPAQLPIHGDTAWQQRVRDNLSARFSSGNGARSARVIAAPIFSSDTVFEDASLVEAWLTVAQKARVLETGTAGVYQAARDKVPFVAIRGVQRLLGTQRNPAWSRYAARTAAAFTCAALRESWLGTPRADQPAPVPETDSNPERAPEPAPPRNTGPQQAEMPAPRPRPAWLWSFIDHQDPMLSALTFLAASLLLIFGSFFLGLNDPQPPYALGDEFRSVGYVDAVNWSLAYTFFAPAFLFLALTARDELQDILGSQGLADMRTRWCEIRTRGFRVWLLLSGSGIVITYAIWLFGSALPLARGVAPEEKDWSIGLLASSSGWDHGLNAVFSALAFTAQAALVLAATTFAVSAFAGGRLVREMPDTLFGAAAVRKRFAPLIGRVLVAGATLISIFYLVHVWKLFLYTDHLTLSDFLLRVPSSWTPDTPTATSFAMWSLAFVVAALCLRLPFEVWRRARHANPEVDAREVWPLDRPGPWALLSIGIGAVFVTAFYWAGAVAAVGFLAYLLVRAGMRVRSRLRAGKPREDRQAPKRIAWVWVSVVAAVVAMLLALVIANVGTLWRVVIAIGVCAFLGVMYINPHRRYFRMASTIIGAVVAGNALPQISAGFNSKLGQGDQWAWLLNQPPGPLFTLGGLGLATTLILLDYFKDTGQVPPIALGSVPAAPPAEPEAPPRSEASLEIAPGYDKLRERYAGVRGAHDWLLSGVTLGVPALGTEVTSLSIGFAPVTAVYLAYHAAALVVWTRVQNASASASGSSMRLVSRLHRYLVRPMRPLVYVAVVASAGLATIGGDETTAAVPTAVYDILGIHDRDGNRSAADASTSTARLPGAHDDRCVRSQGCLRTTTIDAIAGGRFQLDPRFPNQKRRTLRVAVDAPDGTDVEVTIQGAIRTIPRAQQKARQSLTMRLWTSLGECATPTPAEHASCSWTTEVAGDGQPWIYLRGTARVEHGYVELSLEVSHCKRDDAATACELGKDLVVVIQRP